MNEKPVIVQKGPYVVEVEEGKSYYWCSCGLSKNQPFCDGTHKTESTLKPVSFTAEKTGKVYLCGCKMTKTPPFCDGSHSSLD
ncbi:MAG: CDGSH iron-sulfur domain-containing protein [Fusobacteriaceae bacterium]|jgi:CDGSH iron-sulfur domain-containing protein 3|nr:CDGSH iron-sulfur domain-containing protein [Fusobacteriaceae bacterium]